MNSKTSLLIDSLRQRIEFQETQIADLHTQISESQNSIANAIAASDRFLSVASIVIAILIVILGIYVTWCQSRVESIKKIVEEKESSISRLRKEVEQTNKQINGDLSSLYKKLRREETVTLINRLVEVPEDICNIGRQLLSRELMEEDFEILKRAFSKIEDEEDENMKSRYITLFFQHFAGLSIKDDVLRKSFIDYFYYLIPACFRIDIQKSTKDMMAEIINLSPDIRLQIVIPFYKAFINSKFKDMYEIVELLKSVLTEEQWNSVIAQTTEGEEEVDDE